MIRDEGPLYQLPAGVTNRTNLNYNAGETEGPNPESGVIAKALHDHPVMRFFAAAATTMVGMHVAGKLIREGGLRLVAEAEEHNVKWVTNNVKNIRDIHKTLDKLQGVHRVFAEGTDTTFATATKLVARDGKRIQADELIDETGFFFTKGEKEARKAAGSYEGPTEWLYRDAIQKRLVSAARRMPYELPAMYFVQRGLTDRLFGSEDKFKGDWYNPVDVMTDFVSTSVKNLATMIIPFEAGGATVGHGFQKLMTYGDDFVNLAPRQQRYAAHTVVLKDILQRVGHDVTDLANRAVRFSSQSTGAMATGLKEARESSYTWMEYLYETRHGQKQMGVNANAGIIRKVLDRYGAPFKGQMGKTGDLAPGPFRGARTAITAGVKRYNEIGSGYDAFQELMRRGTTGFESWVKQQPNEAAIRNALGNHLDASGSRISEIVNQVGALGGGSTKRFAGSTFFRGQMQNEYSDLIRRELLDEGLPEEMAKQFSQAVRIKPPSLTRESPADLTNRVFFDKEKIHVNSNNDLWGEIGRRVGGITDEKWGNLVNHKLPGAINNADDVFQSEAWQRTVGRKINAQWKLASEKLIPQEVSRSIGRIKPDYKDFDPGNLTPQQVTFLKNRTAQLTGMKVTDQRGKLVHAALIEEHLQKVGFDASETWKMKAFLTTRGAINKPWNAGGKNIFGLAPLTVEEGINKGYFRGSQDNEAQISRLAHNMHTNDPIGMGSYTIDGVYKTSGGRVIDFNRTKQGLQKFMDRMANETQIPLLHFSPLQLLGYGARQDARERSILQYVPGLSNQHFLGRTYGNDDFFLWVRGRGRSGKGKVFAFDSNQGSLSSHELPGLYKPGSARAANIVSKHARIAVGSMGRAPAKPREIDPNSWFVKKLGIGRVERINKATDKLRKAFSVSDDQPDSIWRAAARFRNRNTDINNPRVMFNLLRDGQVTAGKAHIKLTPHGEVVDAAGRVVHDAKTFAESFEKSISALRRKGWSPRLQNILEKDPRFKDFFTFSETGHAAASFGLGGERLLVSDLNTPDQVLSAVNKTIDQDSHLLTMLHPDDAAVLRRAQYTMLTGHLNESGSAAYWERTLPGAGKSSVIHTRLDDLKNDFTKYLAIRAGITNESGFATVVEDMMKELQLLRSAGRISQSEITEARAALLSTQANFISFKTYNAERKSITNVQDLVSRLRNNASMKDAYDDIISGRFDMRDTRMGKISPPFRKRFGMGQYEYQGNSYSPFGDTNTVLIPTFGTAFNRSPMKALGSVLGVGTWKNAEAFSGASVPMGHMVERLNKYQSMMGMGFDPTSFRGPIDMYARGMVMKRALPFIAGGTALLTADRTLGGFLNHRDANGKRVYSPYVLGKAARGAAELQAATGLLPGGMTYQQKRDQIFEGEVPIRAGRFWPLGSTPLKGGRIQYFRPSWYRRLKEGHLYTDQTYGSPMERLAFGYDFSPLRPLNPYWFENKHMKDRPYPVSGEYFTGPWGPLTPALNATVGRVLKPRRMMHEKEVQAGLAAYQPVGEMGAYMPSASIPGGAYAGGMGAGGVAGSTYSPIGSGSYQPGIQSYNTSVAAAGKTSPQRAAGITAGTLAATNQGYASAATINGGGAYGVPSAPGTSVMRPRIITGAEAQPKNSFSYHAGELGYTTQELFGIYGFGFGVGREALGLGNANFTPKTPMLASAAQAYGSTRGFWDLNLGGLGDFPTPVEGTYSNIEFSEIARRFIPKERSDVQTINPIPNVMGAQYPWLPGSDYYLNFKTGDPYTTIQEGEMRLPGLGYERFNKLHSDKSGRYGALDQYKILGDVAPWSPEFRQLSSLVSSMHLTPEEQTFASTVADQVSQKAVINEFTPYKYKYEGIGERITNPDDYVVGRSIEWLKHRDTYFNSKLMRNRTAVEDWERSNVYGSSFPEWQDPVKDFLEPIAYKASQRDPLSAALATSVTGSLFGRTPAAKTVGTIVGGLVGLGASAYGHVYEMATGQRYMPAERRKQLAVDEYSDILTYVKNIRLMQEAEQANDQQNAALFRKAAQQTMYGADVYQGDLGDIAMALPKRKREHFKAMLSAPEQERGQILSTAGRLERRIYEAAWGMPVEKRPELEDYFQSHELPSADWEGFHPNTNMEDIKIKIAQSQGIDLSEMGYYPQQVREANLLNPSYPSFAMQSSHRNTVQQLRDLIDMHGLHGNVTTVRTPYSGTRVNFQAGLMSGV